MSKKIKERINIQHLIKYINLKDEGIIKNYCEEEIENGEQIRIKSIAWLLSEEYPLFIIWVYITYKLMVNGEQIWRNTQFLDKAHGHLRFSRTDLFYSGVYLHQYIVARELDIDISILTQNKFIIHHLNEDKLSNTITNLHIFFDVRSHRTYHGLIKNNVDIFEFSFKDLDSIYKVSNKKADILKVEIYRKLLMQLKEFKGNLI